MEKLSHQNRSMLSVAIVTIVIVGLVTSVVLYSVFMKTPENQLSDLSMPQDGSTGIAPQTLGAIYAGTGWAVWEAVESARCHKYLHSTPTR